MPDPNAPVLSTFRVRARVRETGEPLPQLKLALYGHARMGRKDLLETAVTNERGLARFQLDARKFADRFRARKEPLRNFPYLWDQVDLHIAALGKGDKPVLSVRAAARGGARLSDFSLTIPLQLAIQLGLIQRKPRATPPQKQKRFADYWKGRAAKDRAGTAEIDFCMAGVMMDTLAGIGAPRTKLQRQAAKALKEHLSRDQIEAVTKIAQGGKTVLDAAKIPSINPCGSDANLQDVAKKMIHGGGPVGIITQALSESAPAPDEFLGDPAAGLPFLETVEWDKDCQSRYERGELTGEAREGMARFYPDEPPRLVPPRVNRIDIYEVGLQNYVRFGERADKTLEVRDLDPIEGWVSRTIDMDVSLDDEACLVAVEAEDGRQALAVDVRAGQKVRLMGSSFINKKAHVYARLARWQNLPDDPRLVPGDSFENVAGLHGTDLNVHGDTAGHLPQDTPDNFIGDQIVFDWPEAAREPGLYEIILEFANETDVPTQVEQDSSTCELRMTKDPVQAPPLWFAVLPPLDPLRVRARALSLDCIDETEPESFGPIPYFDDVVFTGSGDISRLVVTPGDPSGLSLETLMTNSDQAGHYFWEDGESQPLSMRILPSGDDSFRLFGLDEIMTFNLLAAEVLGVVDRVVLTALMIAILIVIFIVLIALLIAVVVVLLALEIITAGVATAIIAIVGTIATALFGTILVGAIEAVTAMFAAMPSSEIIALALPQFSGMEVARRLSTVRFHRALLVQQERPPLPDGGMPTTRATSVDAEGLTEEYSCDALGGTYRVRLRLDVE